ncbi:MAG: hypothetical protein K8R48_05790 [Alphaproteobacteria bacterium]|nr:hypothetical protein [Alphaproteobacteria bacterium]
MKLDKEKITAQAVDYGKIGFRLAVKAGILYAALAALGFILGGIGGYWGAVHFGYNAWIGAVCALAGVMTGGLAGFFLAQIVLMGMMQDMLLDAGIQAGKTGFRAAMKLLEEKREKEKHDNGRNKD